MRKSFKKKKRKQMKSCGEEIRENSFCISTFGRKSVNRWIGLIVVLQIVERERMVLTVSPVIALFHIPSRQRHFLRLGERTNDEALTDITSIQGDDGGTFPFGTHQPEKLLQSPSDSPLTNVVGLTDDDRSKMRKYRISFCKNNTTS